jgi:hypothetical protein
MAKRLKISVRAFGSEAPEPELSAVADWIAGRRGRPGDLITCQLESALLPQIGAAVDLPCAGGPFYDKRWLGAMACAEDRVLTGEPFAQCTGVVEDAIDVAAIRKDVWFAVPAPHRLGLTDQYFGDQDEFQSAVHELYRTMMQAMRDCNIGGHVLLCERAVAEELEALARPKTFFFLRYPALEDLALILEHQRQVVISSDRISGLWALMEDYDIGKLILLDPDEEAYREALAHFDPEDIFTGGFCERGCGRYWKDLVTASTVTFT